MKRTAYLLAILAAASLSGCLAVSGTFGYTDPKTGATAGITVGTPQPPPTKLPPTTGFKK